MCIKLIGTFECICVNGWHGIDCSQNVDDCANNACFAGSTCVDEVGTFRCECPPGKAGKC